MEIDVSVDLVSSSCCGVRSPQGKMKQMKKWKNKKHFKRRNLKNEKKTVDRKGAKRMFDWGLFFGCGTLIFGARVECSETPPLLPRRRKNKGGGRDEMR